MTSSEQYTPTTEEVRARHSVSTTYPRFQSPTLRADFDRWLAQVRAEAGAKALRDAADAWAADPGSWGDCEKDYQAELRDRARRIEKGLSDVGHQ